MIDDLIIDLRRDEGFVPHAYKDSEGYLTIGYGLLIDQRVGGGITRDEADYLLRNRLRDVYADLDRVMPWWRDLSPNRQRALANMRYNLGLSRLLGFKKMLTALQRGDYAEAARQALDSLWARQVGDRARRIAGLIREG